MASTLLPQLHALVLSLLMLPPHNVARLFTSPYSVSSNSVLVALLDSPFTEFSELVEKASLLQPFEEVVGKSNVTILAPRNAFLEKNVDADFKRFLLEPGNIQSLQRLLQFHVIPKRIGSADWGNVSYQTLSSEFVQLGSHKRKLKADLAAVVSPDAIVRPDGVVHVMDSLLIPKSVQDSYMAWKKGVVLAVLPEGAPLLDSYLTRKSRPSTALDPPSPPSISVYEALAPGPSLAPAPAPGPSSGHRWFDGEAEVADFISTLVHFGGYNEMADLLVNLTSLAPELGRLVSEGFRITVLAPNDEAMGKLTAEHLSAPGAPEQIIYYHIIPEYQTEESFYNSVKRFGRVTYETLRIPYRIVAQEADGTVQFGEDEDDAAHLYDHDIYIDGRISVQGIDKVLIPHEEKAASTSEKKDAKKKTATKGRGLSEGGQEEDDQSQEMDSRSNSGTGWLSQTLCPLMGRFGGASVSLICQ